MPRTRQASFWSEDPVLQRRAVMGTVGVESVHLVTQLDEEDLAPFNALDFGLDLVQVLQIQLGETLELELLSHVDVVDGERSA